MNKIIFSLIIFLTSCTSISPDRVGSGCEAGSIQEDLFNIVIIPHVKNAEDMYYVEIIVPTFWKGNRLASIAFFSEAEPRLSIDLGLDNFKDEKGVPLTRTYFLAAKEWFNVDDCIKASYLESVDNTTYVREARWKLLLKQE